MEAAAAVEATEQLSGPIRTEGSVVSDMHDWLMQIGNDFVLKQMFKWKERPQVAKTL